MRTIQKSDEPASLTQYRSNRTADFQPTYAGYPDKQGLRESLCRKQRGLCCYCLRRIRPSEESMKIEHLRSQSKHPERQLDYSNLLGACLGGEGLRSTIQHCDTKKGKTDLSFSLTNSSAPIESKLRFPGNGTIQSDDSQIDAEINDVLNLNVQFLVNNRKAVLDAFQKSFGRKKLTRHQIVKLLARFNGDERGDLIEYCQVVVYWIQKRLSRM